MPIVLRHWSRRVAGRNGERVCIPGLRRSELRDGRALRRRWRSTVAKGPVGDLVPKSLRKEPKGELELAHSHHGMRNKETHRIKPRK
jgi:hypothetical protein